MNDENPVVFRPRGGPWWVPLAFAGVAGAGLWLWLDIRDIQVRESVREERLDERLAAIGQREDALAAQDRRYQAALDTLAGSQAELGQRVESLAGARRAGLLASEAEHLARLAAQRLTLMQDPAGALALLLAADAALRDIRDADTHAARAALAADIAQLRAAAAVDVEALYLRLAALPDQVDALAGTATEAAPAAPAAKPLPAPAADAGAWQRLREVLGALVTIRRVDEPLSPMITQGERALAAQNFRLLVEQAQLALLQRRTGIYQHALAQAERWLSRLSAGEPLQRNAIRREIAGLRATDVGRPLPDLTASLAATRALAVRLLPEGGAQP